MCSKPFLALSILCLGLLVASAAMAADAIGSVTRLHGTARGADAGVWRQLATNDPVNLNETVVTGAGARLELTLDDDSVLTLGAGARLRLDAFVYNPRGASRISATVVGAFRFVSGAMQAGARRQASVTTPFAVIGLRGTDFWGGPIDGGFGVFLFDGAVSVTNAGATVDLTAPGQGTSFANAAAPPGPVVVWGQDKVGRALATVTFP
jgi:hypothetical protein